jgi:hypothetical protein
MLLQALTRSLVASKEAEERTDLKIYPNKMSLQIGFILKGWLAGEMPFGGRVSL